MHVHENCAIQGLTLPGTTSWNKHSCKKIEIPSNTYVYLPRLSIISSPKVKLSQEAAVDVIHKLHVLQRIENAIELGRELIGQVWRHAVVKADYTINHDVPVPRFRHYMVERYIIELRLAPWQHMSMIGACGIWEIRATAHAGEVSMCSQVIR